MQHQPCGALFYHISKATIPMPESFLLTQHLVVSYHNSWLKSLLNMATGTCDWVLDFLTQRQQTVRVGNHTFKPITVHGFTPGLCLEPLTVHPFNSQLCRQLPHQTHYNVCWWYNVCRTPSTTSMNQHTGLSQGKLNNLLLLWVKQGDGDWLDDHMSLTGNGAVLKEVKCMEFLGVPLANDTTCTSHSAARVKKAQQRHHALRRPESTSRPTQVLTTFCTETILT